MATSATTDLWSLLAAHSPAPQCLNGQRPTILELPPRVKVPSSPQVTLLRHTGLWAPSVPVCLWFSVPAHWFRQPRPWFPGFSSTSTCGGVLRAPSWCLVGAGCVCTELPAAANSSRCTIQFNAAMLVKTLEKRGASTASGNQFHMYPVISHCQTQCCANILQMTALHNLHQKKKMSILQFTYNLWPMRKMVYAWLVWSDSHRVLRNWGASSPTTQWQSSSPSWQPFSWRQRATVEAISMISTNLVVRVTQSNKSSTCCLWAVKSQCLGTCPLEAVWAL